MMDKLNTRVKAGFADAAAEREQIRQDVNQLRQDVNQLREEMVAGFADAAAERRVLSQRLDKADADRVVMKRDLAELKGTSHEQYYRREAHSVFGAYLRRGKEMKVEIAELLHDALDEGTISESELIEVLAADLLWAGKERLSKEQIILVVEASWLAELTDVERAVARADILRGMGLKAVPVVAGREWAEGIADMAHAVGAVITTNGRMDKASWKSALNKVL